MLQVMRAEQAAKKIFNLEVAALLQEKILRLFQMLRQQRWVVFCRTWDLWRWGFKTNKTDNYNNWTCCLTLLIKLMRGSELMYARSINSLNLERSQSLNCAVLWMNLTNLQSWTKPVETIRYSRVNDTLFKHLLAHKRANIFLSLFNVISESFDVLRSLASGLRGKERGRITRSVRKYFNSMFDQMP